MEAYLYAVKYPNLTIPDACTPSERHCGWLILNLVQGNILGVIEYVETYPEALIYRDQTMLSTAHAIYGMALVYAGNLGLGMDHLRIGYRVLGNAKLHIKAALIFNFTSIVCLEYRQENMARRYVLRACHLAQHSESEKQIAHARINRLGVSYIFGRFQHIQEELSKYSASTWKGEGDLQHGFYNSFLSTGLLFDGATKEAISASHEAEEALSDTMMITFAYQVRARAFIAKSNYSDAIELLNRSVDCGIESGYHQAVATSAALLAEAYSAAGRPRQVHHLHNTLLRYYPLKPELPEHLFYLEDSLLALHSQNN